MISSFPTPTPSRTQSQDVFDAAVEAFLTHLPTFVTEANAVATAMNLNSTTDTSASSVAIGTGAKTFTVSSGKSFQPGMYVVIADAASPSTNLMVASITSYSGTSLVVNVEYVRGSGTMASWVISQSAPAANIAEQIHGATNKTTPIGADEVGIWDSVSGLLNRVSFTNMLDWFAAKLGNVANVFSVAPATAAAHAPQAQYTRQKNDIINGQFRIAQIGTSFVAPTGGVYDLDGWLNGNTGAAVFTVAQVAGSSTGKLARQVTITTADASVAAGDLIRDVTKIEGYNIVKYVGNTFTVAFRAKVPVAGIHCVALLNSGRDRSYVHEVSFPVANVWQDVSFTVVGGLTTAGTWDYINGVGLSIEFAHMAGSTLQTATTDSWVTGAYLGTANQVNDAATIGNVWALEDVRIALGEYAPPSDTSYDEDLAYVQRYAYNPLYGETAANLSFGQVVSYSTSASFVQINIPVSMRAIPSLVIIGAASDFSYGYPGAAAFTGLSIAVQTTKHNAYLTGAATFTAANEVHEIYRPGTTSILYLAARL